MESNENNGSSSSKETSPTNDEDANMQATTSSSTSPKRCKLDPNAPSTSNHNECKTDQACSTDEKNINSEDVVISENSDAEKTNKSSTFRFAKRTYRRRNDSQSSTNSVPMEEPNTEQNAEATNNTNPNNQENCVGDELISMDEDSTFSTEPDGLSDSHRDGFDDDDDDDDDNDSSSSSDTETDDSTDNEQKTQNVLNKPKPKCDLDLVRNLIYRQSGIFYKSDRRTYDTLATRLTQRINSSIYTVERMALLHKLERHYGCVNCLNFNKAGNLLVTGSDDLRVIVWNWAKRQPIIVQKCGHRSNIFQSKFIDNGSANNQTDFNLITSARDGEVRQIQVAPDGSAKERLILQHNHPVHKIAIPDSNQNEVLTAGEDGCVIQSDLRDNRVSDRLVELKVDDKEVALFSVAHHPFDPEFCICGRDKYVRVYDRRNVKECSRMFCPENIRKQTKSRNVNITCALYNYNGSEILASYGDENIYLFDTAVTTPGVYKQTYYGHKNRQTIKGVNFFGPCSEFIMSGSDCGNFFMWDKNSEAIVQWLHGDDTGVVNCLEGHPNFPIIATSGLDNDVKIWSPSNPHLKGRPSEPELKKCIKENLKHQTHLMRTYMRNIVRLVNGNFNRNGRSSSDTSDSDDDDDDDGDDFRTLYRRDRDIGGPCEVQ